MSQTEKRQRLILYGLAFAVIASIAPELLLIGPFAPTEAFEISGRITVIFLSAFVIFFYAAEVLGIKKIQRTDFVTLSIIHVGSVLLVQISQLIAASVASYSSMQQMMFTSAKEGLYLGIPFAAGSMITQSVLGARVSLITSVMLAVTVGVYLPEKSLLVPYVLVTSLVATMTMRKYRTRSSYIKAGIHVSLISLPFAFSSVVLGENGATNEIVLRLVSVCIGGLLCAFIVAGVTPVIESLGGYVTSMRLLEMATLDHPLLKELSIQAPGTWNHSMVMGMMVESAADAIGANPVLTRVGAYFHDVGKSKKPLYFVENQHGEENPHHKLSPSMSALIIRSHVKDGIEIAKKAHLPQALIDMIPQHHGTAVIEYFYEKALKDAGEGEEVDKSLYSYPGPKPQTKEAGILMLADGVEAAARTLSEPTQDRLQGLVQKMINKVFSSGQLNECELTLRDLHLIAKCFTRVLSAIYHQRIAYAEPAEKTNEQPQAVAHPKEEDLKRLGQDEVESS